MRFVRAHQLRKGDVALLAGDDVDEIFGRILTVLERQDGRLHFRYSWRNGQDYGTEDKMVLPRARCLLIRRPKRRRRR